MRYKLKQVADKSSTPRDYIFTHYLSYATKIALVWSPLFSCTLVVHVGVLLEGFSSCRCWRVVPRGSSHGNIDNRHRESARELPAKVGRCQSLSRFGRPQVVPPRYRLPLSGTAFLWVASRWALVLILCDSCWVRSSCSARLALLYLYVTHYVIFCACLQSSTFCVFLLSICSWVSAYHNWLKLMEIVRVKSLPLSLVVI